MANLAGRVDCHTDDDDDDEKQASLGFLPGHKGRSLKQAEARRAEALLVAATSCSTGEMHQ